MRKFYLQVLAGALVLAITIPQSAWSDESAAKIKALQSILANVDQVRVFFAWTKDGKNLFDLNHPADDAQLRKANSFILFGKDARDFVKALRFCKSQRRRE